MKQILVLLVAATFLVSLGNRPLWAEEVELPKGLKGLSLGGTYFIEYYNQDFDDDTRDDDFSSFRVQRAYITVKKKFTPWFSSRVTSDITYDSKRGAVGADAKEVGWEFRLKYTYGKFDFKSLGGTDLRLESEVGLVHTASDDYDSALWPYRAQGKHFLDRHSIMSSADFGINVRLTFGEMDEGFKKRISKKYAGKWGGIWAGVYNGAWYGHQENNDDKIYDALAYVRPFNMIDFLKGLRVGYHVARGESDELLAGGVPKEYPDWEIDQFLASYQHEYFTLMGQWYSGKSEDRSSDQNDRDGYNIAAFVKMPFEEKLRIFARYDVYDKDDSKPDYDETTTIYGVSYDFSKGVMAWAGIEDKDYDRGLNKNDYRMIQVALAIKF